MITWGEIAYRTETHAIGGGEWSIEVYDEFDNFLKEFVGSNGTRYDEDPDDLWEWYERWCDLESPYMSYEEYCIMEK